MSSRKKDPIYCPTCGLRIEPEYQFCLGCGAPLKANSSRKYSYTPPSAIPTSTTQVIRTPARNSPPKDEVSNARIVANYAISIIIFIPTAGISWGILYGAGSALPIDPGFLAFINIAIAAAISGIIGGFITKQHIPFKVVGSIILIVMAIGTILIYLAFQSAQESTSPYAGFGLALAIVIVIGFTISLIIILVTHAGFTYFGASLRK